MPLIDLNGLGHFKDRENAMIAAEYSASETYAVGQHAYYKGTLYRCKTAITTAEAWTAAHWTAAKLAEDVGELKSAFALNVGGGDTTIHATDLTPYEGYWSGNVDTRKMTLATSTTYYTIEHPIDISSLKVGTNLSVMASLTSAYGVYITNKNNALLDYINGNNAASKGYTTGSTPQLVTMKIPDDAKYLVTDIRKTAYVDMSIFDVKGVLKSNIDINAESCTVVEETVDSLVDSYARNSDFIYPFFEVGGINISTDASNPWVYDDTQIRYIRTKQNYTIHLKPNDVVGLASYSDGQLFSCGWSKKNGTYSRELARSSDYTVVDEGDYVFVLYQNPFEYYTETYGLADLFFIHRAEITPAIRYKRLDKYPIKGIGHRGYTYEGAPENTLPSFRAAKTKGFHYVETDIAFTSDDIPVLLHDTTINRVARNSDGTELSGDVGIADITYAQALEYDFGIAEGEEYAGTTIMTMEELLIFCRANDMFPYFELKSQASLNTVRLQQLLGLVKKYDMMDACAFISFSYSHLYNLSKLAPEIKIGRISDNDFDDTTKGELLMLKTEINDVVLLLDLAKLTAAENAVVTFCQTNGIKLGIEMSNNISEMQNANNYVTECTSNHYNFTEVIANREMGVT